MNNTSPPYILTYMADAAGCGYHRIARPLEILIKSGYAIGRGDFQVWEPDRIAALKPDVIVWQRQHEDFQIANIQRTREAVPDAFFVYEIDDILSACPEWSPHRHHIPYDVDDRMTKALKLCDAATVSTKTLAAHIRSLCGDDFDIRVVPNMLSREDLTKVDEIKQKLKRLHFKVRIGWGGGISHLGDLNLLIPAMEKYREVEWVFIAQQPETNLPVEFHPGVPPNEYLAKLASLDLDLMVAPLVDNHFNRCKSNLRLLEGGACKYPTIASPVEPYVEGSPPVYAYANSSEEWIDSIGRFLVDSLSKSKGEALRSWVERRYLADDRLDERVRGWSPRGSKTFSPKRRSVSSGKPVFVCSEPNIVPEGFDVRTSFDSLIDQNCDIIYVRRGTLVTKSILEDLTKHLTANNCCVIPLSNDGGFPKPGVFVGIDKDKADGINELCHDIVKDVVVPIPFPYGPVMILARRALDVLGFPDLSSPEDLESSLTEWGVLATARGFQVLLCCGVYVQSVFPAPQHDINQLSKKLQLRYNLQIPPDPLRDFRTHLELAFFKKFYTVPVPSQNSSYDEWFSIFDTLSKKDKQFIDEYVKGVNFDIRYYGSKPDETLAEWVLFADQSSIIADQFVYFFNEAFKNNLEAVFAYADHDFVNEEGKRVKHNFKRHILDYDFLLGTDYVSQICAIRTSALKELWRNTGEVKSSQIYKLALDLHLKQGPTPFVHVPRILAHLQEIPKEEQVKAAELNKKIAYTSSKLSIQTHKEFPQYNTIDYNTNIPDPPPKVSIIIPTKNRVEMLSPCVESLLHFTDYPNYEIIIVDNGSTNPKQIEYQKLIAEKYSNKLTVLSWPNDYNWSALNNWAVRYTKGDYLLFLNDDTRFAEPPWLSQMVGAAIRPWVGAVGIKLLYPSGLVQHVGVVHSNGLCGHAHKMLPGNLEGANGLAVLSHSDTAVTGACMLVSTEKFKEVGGFNEKLVHNFNDIAFCLDLNKLGYTNITVCSAMVQHLEGVTRTSPATLEGQHTMRREAILLQSLYPSEDTYWNPNLSFIHTMGGLFVTGLNYDMLKWPAPAWPWRDDKSQPEKVLLIGDDGPVWVDESRTGNVCFLAMLNGYNMQIARPSMENVPLFDIRDQETAKRSFSELGITKIIVRSILGGVVEMLPFLSSLGHPIEYRPNTAESVCPRIDCKQDGHSCGRGWQNLETCNECITSYNSPFGQVKPEMWRSYWSNFIASNASNNVADIPSELQSPLLDIYLNAFTSRLEIPYE